MIKVLPEYIDDITFDLRFKLYYYEKSCFIGATCISIIVR